MKNAFKHIGVFVVASVFMAGVGFAQDNDATVTQTGNSHTATVTQVGSGNDVLNAVQSGAVQGGVGNTLTIDQSGTRNLVDGFSQFDERNVATITQVGRRNDVGDNPDQGRDPNDPSRDGTITVLQYGDRNDVWDLDQRGDGPNDITINQGMSGASANRNVVDMDMQRGTNNEVTINQYSDGNYVGMKSSAVRGVFQQGDGNSLTITQDGSGGHRVGTALAPGSSGFVLPQASNNAIYQFGKNSATITQEGSSQTVDYLVQENNVMGGLANVATIDQSGMDHVTRVAQFGSNNTGTVTQQ